MGYARSGKGVGGRGYWFSFVDHWYRSQLRFFIMMRSPYMVMKLPLQAEDHERNDDEI